MYGGAKKGGVRVKKASVVMMMRCRLRADLQVNPTISTSTTTTNTTGKLYLGVVDEPDEGLALLDRLPEDGHLHAGTPQVGGAVHVLVFGVPWGAGGVWRRRGSQARGGLAYTARHTFSTIQSSR